MKTLKTFYIINSCLQEKLGIGMASIKESQCNASDSQHSNTLIQLATSNRMVGAPDLAISLTLDNENDYCWVFLLLII